jgi:hypothetical protein
MRFIVEHDEQGNLKGLVISPPNSPLLKMVTKPGQLMTEVELPEDIIKLAHPPSHDALRNVLQNFQIEVSTAKAKLIRKSKSTSV